MEVTHTRPVVRSAGGWSSRQGTLAIALVATLAAAGILVFALHRYRRSIESSAKPATVLVANRFIEKGTAGAAIGVGKYFRTAKILDKQVAQGALTSSAALHGEVAAVDIYPGQQLTAADFASGGLFYSKLPPNQRAVSVPVNISHGLVGDVQTGDRVDVYVSFPRELDLPAYVRLVAPDVVVLDAGRVSDGGTIAASSASAESNVVLEVDAHQAAELAFSADNGKVWLVLRPAHGTSPQSELVSESSILAENHAAPQGGAK
ncbi:MAG: Flp pilus assembly protein CpaB [Vulcanimicrobiaceae bacterium]